MTEYPERLPKNLLPVSTFTFTTKGVDDVKKDCSLQLEALGERIKRISDKFTITLEGRPFNMIDRILDVCRDEDELKGISKGLGRVAEIISKYDSLEAKMNILDLIEKDPNWFMWAFGNFEAEVENDIAKLDQLLEEVEEYES